MRDEENLGFCHGNVGEKKRGGREMIFEIGFMGSKIRSEERRVGKECRL